NLQIIYSNLNYPLWLKFISLTYFLYSLFVSYTLLFWKIHPNLQISGYGFFTNNPLSLVGITLILVFLLNGFSAFQILFEKKNAIQITKLTSIIGISICLLSLLKNPFLISSHSFSFPFEIFVLVIVYSTVRKIELRK